MRNCTNNTAILAFWLISLQLMGTNIRPSGGGGDGTGNACFILIREFRFRNYLPVCVVLGQGNCVGLKHGVLFVVFDFQQELQT